MALTSGVTWRRILPRTSTGSVCASVPPRNCDVMTSSREKVRHRSPATTIAGRQQRQRDAAEDAPAVGPEVGRRLLQRDAHRREARLHDDRRVGRVEDDVADDDRPTPSPMFSSLKSRKSPSANTTSGSTIREYVIASNHARARPVALRYQSPPVMARTSEMAVDEHGDLHADAEVLAHRLVVERLLVPLQREALPVQELGVLVQREHDDEQDRRVEARRTRAR